MQGQTKHKRIKEYIIEQIISGELAPDGRVESMTALSRTFSVNKNTAVKVLNELEHEGYIYKKKGVGCFVSPRTACANRAATIGVIVKNIDSPIYGKIIRNIDQHCHPYHYNVIASNVFGDFELEKKVVDNLIEQQKVDSLVVFPARGDQHEIDYFESVARHGVSVVYFGEAAGVNHMSTACFDYYEGVKKETEHLLANGYKHLKLIVRKGTDPDIHSRIYGFRTALEGSGLTFDNDAVMYIRDAEEEYGYQIADEIAEMADPPEAIVTVSDEVAIGLINRLLEKGIRVPQDIAIAGGGNIDLGMHPGYSLTTITPDYNMMGRQLVDFLCKHNDHSETRQQFVFKQDLIVRNSSAPIKHKNE